MPLASNPLLSTSSSVSSLSRPSTDRSANTVQNGGSSFSDMLAGQSSRVDSSTANSASDTVSKSTKDTSAKTDTSQKSAASTSKVADSGKDLPAGKGKAADKSDDTQAADDAQAVKDDTTVSQDDSAQAAQDPSVATTTDSTAVQPQPDPSMDPASLLQALTAQNAAPATAPTATQATGEPVLPTLASITAPTTTTATAAQATTASTSESTEDDFDPLADPLENLPMVRLGLEQSAKAEGRRSAHATDASVQDPTQGADAEAQASNLATLLDPQAKASGDGQTQDQTFGSLLDDGLQDVKAAGADTRMDNFANRLAALTDTSATKLNAANQVGGLMAQPLAVNSGGFTEGLVNRVMYLSSQNLKSADIQLTPAELGRLDIRVNLTADQAAQVTFTSAHAQVRDTLENQMHRLKDMLGQEGFTRLDVNVSDQSGSQRDQQPQKSSRGGSSGGVGGVGEVGEASAAEQVAETQVVIGSSLVDQYV